MQVWHWRRLKDRCMDGDDWQRITSCLSQYSLFPLTRTFVVEVDAGSTSLFHICLLKMMGMHTRWSIVQL